MRVSLVSVVVWVGVSLCALAGFFGPLSNSALAQYTSISNPPVLGLDVYYLNGVMNWPTIAANTDIDFAMVKAAEGDSANGDIQDPQLQNNLNGGTAAGLYVGSYDFARPSTDTPMQDAQFFVSYAQQYGAFGTGKLLPMLDMEDDNGPIAGATSLAAWINAWGTDVYTLTGVHPLLYVNENYISSYGLTPSNTGLNLWLAAWSWANPTRPPSNSSMAGRSPIGLSGWSSWSFWQYSDYGSVNGDPDTAADVDAFGGTLAQLVANDVIPALTWSGATNSTWDNATTGTGVGTQNWVYGNSGSTGSLYFDNRAVIFQDKNLITNGTVSNSTVSISTAVTPQLMTFTANSVNYTFNGSAIAGSGDPNPGNTTFGDSIVLNGTASVTLNNGTSASPNTFTGAIVISKGQLILDNPWSTGNSSGASVASGGALVLNNTGPTVFGNLGSGGGTIPLAITGTGLTASPAGALSNPSGANVYAGAISLSGNATIESVGSGSNLSLSGGITTNGHTLTIAGAGTTTVSGPITGSGTLQINSGTFSVWNTSSPLGSASIALNGGTLQLSAQAASGSNAIGINVAADGGTVGSSSGEQPETMSATASAGAAPISNWNNLVITRYTTANHYSSSNLPTNPQPQSVASSVIPLSLVSASGALTTAQVTSWAGGNTFSVYGSTQTNNDAQLNNGLLGAENSSSSGVHPSTITVGNIPYSSGYNLYVYFNNNIAGEDAVISATSGTYTSTSYYVSTEGLMSSTTSFYVNGSSSTTAGNYQTSNFVEIPIPAMGTSGATNSFTVNLSAPIVNEGTPGITAIEVVGDGAGPTLSNATTVSGNSTIDVTGISSATLGTLSIGTKTLSVTGGSIGAADPYTLTFGATTLTGNATIQVANNSSGSGAGGIVKLGGVGQSGGTFGIAIKGPGEVVFTAPGSYGGPTLVDSGQLVLTNATATGNSNGATVFPGGALVLQNNSGNSMTFGQTVGGGSIGLTLNGTGLSANPGGALLSFGTNTYAGAISLGSSATISSAANSTLTLSSSLTVPASDTLQFGGGGTVAATGGFSFGNGSSIQVNAGTATLNPASTPTIGTGMSATVASGATLQLAGNTSALSNSSSGNSASVANSGTLSVTGSGETVGAISGSGTTAVADGASLMASQIVQSAVTVGNGSVVSIIPQSTGSPGVSQASSSPATPSVSSTAAAAGSSPSSDPFVAIESTILADNAAGSFSSALSSIENDFSTAESQLDLSTINNAVLLAEFRYLSGGTTEPELIRRATIDKSIWNLENPPPVVNDIGTGLTLSDGSLAGGTASPVPEPSAIVLAALGLLSVCLLRRRAHGIAAE